MGLLRYLSNNFLLTGDFEIKTKIFVGSASLPQVMFPTSLLTGHNVYLSQSMTPHGSNVEQFDEGAYTLVLTLECPSIYLSSAQLSAQRSHPIPSIITGPCLH